MVSDMRAKKPRTSDSVSKRVTRKKVAKESDQSEVKLFPLTVLPEEKRCSDGHMKTRLSFKVDEKRPKVILPKIKITCVPLNVEKIIDFESNSFVLNAIEESKSNSECKSGRVSQTKSRKSTSAGSEGVPSNENLSSREPSKCRIAKTRQKVKDSKKKDFAGILVSPKTGINDKPNENKNPEILANEYQPNYKEQLEFSCSCSTETDTNIQSFQISSNKNYEEDQKSNLDVETVKAQESADCLPLCRIDDEAALLELNHINLEELASTLESLSDETLKIKGNENLPENEADVIDTITSLNTSLNSANSNSLRCKDLHELGEVKNNLTTQSKTSLQATVESLLSNSQLKCLKETSALKKGLCLTWLSNNYVCANHQCFYSHCAIELFTKKMGSLPSKFILNIVVSMTDDTLFVDVIMAAFKILCARKVSAVWVTFLIYFVFYVTEPSDLRFLKFWANAARFYCQLSNEYAAANGFASLLAVFSNGGNSEEWKIIEFIKLIKQPPIQVSTNYELLQPILKLDLPSQFLTDAVESCIATQKDVLKVYLCVIPKISFMTSPIQTVELLLKFSKILEGMELKTHANDLKRRLRTKVKSIKTKITYYDYPLAAAFQENLFLNPKENESLDVSESTACAQKQVNMSLEAVNQENNYFQLENDLSNRIVQALEMSRAGASSRMKMQLFLSNKTNEIQKDGIGERQINKIEQFFSHYQFYLLGKYLNDLKPNVLEQAAEEFLKLFFQMKISLQQGVNLIRIILLQCKSESAAKVIASICVTFILNLVKINEWEKAHLIMSLCEEKQVKLIEGKVFYFNFNEFSTVSQCRIALLLIEMNVYSGSYERAVKLVKNYFLFSSNSSMWELTWEANDENIRIKIVEDFLQQVIIKESAQIMYDLFVSIWMDQKQLNGAIDLRKFVNEVIIIMLNEGNEEGVILYEKVKAEIRLNDTTTRAVLITLVRLNRLSPAKSILISTSQNIYSIPQVTSGCAAVMISSFWLEEEIYMVFDAFLESLAAKKHASISAEFEKLEINIQITKPNFISPRITPLCLGIISPAFKDACSRIQRVLYQFSSPLKLIIMPYHLKLDECSLQIHLQNRLRKISG